MNLETIKSQSQSSRRPDVKEESVNPLWFSFAEVRQACSSLIHIANVLQELVSNSKEHQTGFSRKTATVKPSQGTDGYLLPKSNHGTTWDEKKFF